MNDHDARDAIARIDVPRETMDRLDRYAAMLKDEARHQNLVAKSTLDMIWTRHFLDAAQLLSLAPSQGSRWIDLGSGAGLPGLVLACCGVPSMTLVEMRRLRTAFLRQVVERLDLRAVTVIEDRLERYQAPPFHVITARALAPLPSLFERALHLSTSHTVWLLPKGRSAQTELAMAQRTWQGEFAVVPSLTDSGSGIIVGRNVARREGR